jgi:hypothetical protein
MVGEHIALDVPLMKKEFVGPELLPAHRGQRDIQRRAVWLSRPKPAEQSRRACENQHDNEQESTHSERSGFLRIEKLRPCSLRRQRGHDVTLGLCCYNPSDWNCIILYVHAPEEKPPTLARRAPLRV